MENYTFARENLAQISDRIGDAAAHAGRSPEDITLIAVSKTFEADAIIPAIEAGQALFGENRVQEAKAKWPALRGRYPAVKLHLIGPLQSNKAKEAVALFDAIHTIDRPKIARAIAAEMVAQERMLELFVQVNIGGEPQKAGIAPDDTDAFVGQCHDEFGLEIAGLMCIPPVDEPPEPFFERLAALAAGLGLGGLSMGMSADFESAIRSGATHIRVGSAIFGGRDYTG
ncbi:MAG: YggS family pyridoxal phosphate-dependent enzyme [Hyphomicrobiales bacterium]|nr:YggS family pyridoxal phosphate-dependent enzyme [Hyphomicrobiales bacterium]